MLRIAKDCKNIDKGMVNPCLPLTNKKNLFAKSLRNTTVWDKSRHVWPSNS